MTQGKPGGQECRAEEMRKTGSSCAGWDLWHLPGLPGSRLGARDANAPVSKGLLFERCPVRPRNERMMSVSNVMQTYGRCFAAAVICADRLSTQTAGRGGVQEEAGLASAWEPGQLALG